MENMGKVIKEKKGWREEWLMRMLKCKMGGWGGYYEDGGRGD